MLDIASTVYMHHCDASTGFRVAHRLDSLQRQEAPDPEAEARAGISTQIFFTRALIGGVGEIDIHNCLRKTGASRTVVVDFHSINLSTERGRQHRHRGTTHGCCLLLSLVSDSLQFLKIAS